MKSIKYESQFLKFITSLDNNLLDLPKIVDDSLECISKLESYRQVKLLVHILLELRQTHHEISTSLARSFIPAILIQDIGVVSPGYYTEKIWRSLGNLNTVIYDCYNKIDKYMINQIKIGVKEATDPSEFVALKLRGKYSENQYLRLMESFRILWRINKMCDSPLKTEDLIEELKLLKRYTSDSKEVTKAIDEFLRLVEAHIGNATKYVTEDYKEKTNKFAERLLDIWIAEFLEK